MQKERSATVPVLGKPGTYEEVFREGDTVLLTVKARWPRLEGEGPGFRRVNRYYEALADRWKKRWSGPLLADAKAAMGPETPPWKASLDFTVTLLENELFSLYWEAAEDIGARRPRRVRQGDVWRLPQGVPLTLRELLPTRRWWRGPVLEEVRRQIGERLNTGEAVFYEEWPSLASRKFSPGRFYLTADGPAVFYPVESIAPAMEGFPAFSLGGLVEGPQTQAKSQEKFAKVKKN